MSKFYYSYDSSDPVDEWLFNFLFHSAFIHLYKCHPILYHIKVLRHRYALHYGRTMAFQFNNGYCMLMAELLQRVFNGGEIVWLFPAKHIGWRSPEGATYDIDGKLKRISLPSEYGWEAIPISYFTENIIHDYEKIEEMESALFIQESLKAAFRYRDDTPSFNFTNGEIIEMFRQSYDGKEERKIYEEAVNNFCYSAEVEESY